MRAESFRDNRGGVTVTMMLDAMEAHESQRLVYEKALMLAAETLAAQIVKDHGQEIIAKIDMQAIANLTVAEAADGIRQVIHKKLPDVVRHSVETEIYERGFFGGVRRVR